MTSWVNKELTRFGDCKICHHVDDSPTSKFSLYRLVFVFLKKFKVFNKKERKKIQTQLANSTHVHTPLLKNIWSSRFLKKKYDCGNVSFLFFVAFHPNRLASYVVFLLFLKKTTLRKETWTLLESFLVCGSNRLSFFGWRQQNVEM